MLGSLMVRVSTVLEIVTMHYQKHVPTWGVYIPAVVLRTIIHHCHIF